VAFAALAALGLAAPPAVEAASAGDQSGASKPAGKAAQPRPDPATVAKLLEQSQSAPVRVIVEFSLEAELGRAHRPDPMLSAAEANAQRLAVERVGSNLLARLGGTSYGAVKTFTTLPLVALEAGPEALRRLAADPAVVRIQEDLTMRPFLAESIPLIGADDVFADGHTGSGWAIAVLDTGADTDHPFLAGRAVAEACYSSTASNALSVCPGGANESTAPGSGKNCPARVSGCDHGTHVTGIAAGSGRAFSGVARDGQLIPIQVFSRFGGADCLNSGLSSPCVFSFTSDLTRALERVLELSEGLDIAAVNMSLGGGAFSSHCDNDVLKLAIDNLRAAGIATVVASGNDGLDGMISSPACISSAIAVGSTTEADQISGFSNHASIIDLLAPGSSITSSVPGNRFAIFNGTSMATPHVAGAFALLRGADPSATVDQIETALESTGRLVSRAGIAKPRIQVDAALDALLGAGGRPFNDDFADAVLLAGASGSVTGSNSGATAQPREPNHANLGGGRSVWWRWRAPQDGTATLSTLGSDFDTVLAVYTGPGVGRLTEVAKNDDSGDLLQSWVEFQATGGTTYHVAVDGYAGAEGNIVLSYELDAAGGNNDNFGRAIVLTGAVGVTTGSNQGATAQPGELVHAGVGGGRSVWWRWRAPASGDTMFATVGSDFDTVLAVYRGGRLRNLREIASNDDGPGLGLQSMVRFDAEAGLNYRIAVDGFNGAEGNITLMFANLAALPATVAAAGGAAPRDPARELWSKVAKYARLD
jgi:subtilisin family serine protease